MTIANKLKILAEKIEASPDHSIANSVLLEALELTQFSKSTSAPLIKRIVTAYHQKWGSDPGVLDIHTTQPEAIELVTWNMFEWCWRNKPFMEEFRSVCMGTYTVITPERFLQLFLERRLHSLSEIEAVLAKTAKQYINYKKLSGMLQEKIAPLPPLRAYVAGED